MDYEKLHKDTIAKLQEMVNSGKITVKTACGICADFVPESEDERMVKFIKNQLFNIKKTITENYELDAKLTKAIDWLEKQGKQETDEWKEGNIIRHGGILALVIKGRRAMKSNGEIFTIQYPDEWVKALSNEIEHFLNEFKKQSGQKPVISNDALREGITHFGITQHQIDNWLKKYVDVEKQGEQNLANSAKTCKNEQKPIDKIQPKFKVGQTIKKEGFNLGFNIVKIDDDFYYNNMGDYFPFTDQDNWELVEQKPAWSEEDETRYESCIKVLQTSDGYDTINTRWVKSLKDRVQPQPKQEWSEEDENRFNNLIFLVEHSDENKATKEGFIKFINKLKSLRPQNWKPSKEQIIALRWVLNNVPYCTHKEEISGLLDQIKEL